jgi:O-methyltransferase involved in polyketide biosynthesis
MTGNKNVRKAKNGKLITRGFITYTPTALLIFGLLMYATSTAHLISLNLITSNIRLSVQTITLVWVFQFLLPRNFSLLQNAQNGTTAHHAS